MPRSLLVFAVALAARLVLLWELSGVALFRTPQLDSREYWDWARVIARGDFVWPMEATHGPGYPLFLALFGDALTAARIVQCILGALTCCFVYWIGRTRFSDNAGLAAGLLLALYGPLILIDVSILAEGLLLFLLTAAVYCATQSCVAGLRPAPVKRHAILWPIVSGLLLAAAVIVRPTAIVAVPVLLYLLWGRSAVRFAIVFALAIAAVLLLHRGQPIQARADMNFYQGMSPLGTGTASARLGRGWDELVARDHYVSTAFNEITRMPLQFAKLILSKIVWVTQSAEIRDSHSFYFFRSQSLLLKIAIPFGILFGLAIAGIYRKFDRALFALIVLFALTLVFLMAGYRYRMPMIPFLALFAGVALTEIRSKAVIAIALVACALSFVRPHRQSRNLAEEWDFDAISRLQEGDTEGARQSYERALDEDPTWVRAIGGLAHVAIDQHRYDDAAGYVDRALKTDPRYADGHYAAGLLAQLRHDAPGAAHAYGAVLALQPDRVEALKRYAEALTATGELAKARASYEHVLELVARGAVAIPYDDRATIHLRVAELSAAQGKFDDAIAFAQKAANIEPTNPQAWMLMCMAGIDGHRLDVAREAFERARALADPNDPNLAIVAQRLTSAGV